MAFINEPIPESDRAKYNACHIRKSWGGELVASRWTIDRERDAFLVFLGGTGDERQGDRPYLYALAWQGAVTYFSAWVEAHGNWHDGVRMRCRLFNIGIPRPLANRAGEVLQLMRDAIDVEAFGHRRDRVTEFHIQMDPPSLR